MKILNKYIFLFIFVFAMPFVGISQMNQNTTNRDVFENNNINTDIINRNTVYFELLGNGFTYSIGYDRLLIQANKNNISFSKGLTFSRDGLFMSPQINYFYGKEHCFEIGFGITTNMYRDKKGNVLTDNTRFYRVGYRYQQKGGSNFYRIAFTPFASDTFTLKFLDIPIFPWIGATIGRTF